ncbi:MULTISPECIES: DUF2075 domain-containing protein [unclassified Acinetobacter]|uniref:DUF2075 domain-containing protein n=1 Tax=unclassified Acinetobacter TaxID=196816 RepID=UPI0015D32B63|nr:MULTISPECIES: DUF2075 domain-containing protein [unclassified Acinetobacter]
MLRSYYQSSIQDFLSSSNDLILGNLAQHHEFALEDLQKNAWLAQIDILKANLVGIAKGHLYFEYSIPRMGKRADNILIIRNLIFVIEFKVGESFYSTTAKNQVIDYCLDLKNFHSQSHDKKIIPILVATEADTEEIIWEDVDDLGAPICCHQYNLNQMILQVLAHYNEDAEINVQEWNQASYRPTPTIIEAAKALYQGHQVEDISRSDAGAINLKITSARIEHIIETTKEKRHKAICFLTGVPGAGKTLAGLNIANQRLKKDESEHSVFLSGNGPLVDVLKEALIRQTVETAKTEGQLETRSSAERKAKAFIQNIHHFRDEYLRSLEAPIEKVVVFDEAQRAWRKEQVSNFMKQKKGIQNFDKSEPQFLIEVMDRHTDWCVIICLIGSGQEINTGEAGVIEWLDALQQHYPEWQIYYSEKILEDRVYIQDQSRKHHLIQHGNKEPDLHLAVSVRSFRSERVAELVQAILDGDATKAQHIYSQVIESYPIVLTRNLERAKSWLKQQAKGTERYGMVASSGARRLKAEGIDVKNKITPSDWFLNSTIDVRSSYYLEDVATEFDVQGLELDYCCVAWDINFYFKDGWCYQAFKGTKWQNINQMEKQKYLLNTYRVLLTRARQGVVIYLPNVDDNDWTRPSELYDSTYQFLKACHLKEI